ncbi:MAG: type I glutamate--ammonia ligase [Anaerolineaceae bacterium]|nr:type I glutamate--ammonia ligase [Anaerolineaceae bacterium]
MDSHIDIVRVVKEKGLKFIDLQFTDVVGLVKSITIPSSELPDALKRGIWFDGSAIEGYARIAESDMHLIPDLTTFSILPWLTGDRATARLICDVFTPDGQPFQGDPRAVLRRAIDEAAKLGFNYNTGPEMEFFLMKPHPDGSLLPLVPHDMSGYFDAPTDMAQELLRQMAFTLETFGIQIDAMHHEVAPGQLEIDLHYSDSLRTADSAVTFRVALKAIAQQNGFYCTFLPKPMQNAAGSGMHVHQSLTYTSTEKNAFADPGDTYGLSQTARHFIAGQLLHSRSMCAVLAPLVNSYKRMASGYEAPISINWGRINRTALIRVPRASSPETIRLELRCPDPSCNPYLAFAVMLAAGLDGIKHQLPLPDAAEERLYQQDSNTRKSSEALPGSLNQALIALEADEVIQNALGPVICDRFINAKRLEWDEYRREVSPWELSRYLPLF